LSGGQSAELASARLNAMNVRFKSRLPWALSFSFARAIQQPALEIWKGEDSNVLAAQRALYNRAMCNRAARRGEYNAAMEKNIDLPENDPAAPESYGASTVDAYRQDKVDDSIGAKTSFFRKILDNLWGPIRG
jgi:hypothetical protein